MSPRARQAVRFGVLVAVLALLPGGSRAVAATPTATVAPRGPSPKATAPRMVLPFIDDDYDRALAEARRLEIPIFIEAWAPW